MNPSSRRSSLNRSRSESPRIVRGLQATPRAQNQSVGTDNSSSDVIMDVRPVWHNPNAASPAALRHAPLSLECGTGAMALAPPPRDHTQELLVLTSVSPSVSSYSPVLNTPLSSSSPRVNDQIISPVNAPHVLSHCAEQIRLNAGLKVAEAEARASAAEAREKAFISKARETAVWSVAQSQQAASQVKLEAEIMVSNSASELQSVRNDATNLANVAESVVVQSQAAATAAAAETTRVQQLARDELASVTAAARTEIIKRQQEADDLKEMVRTLSCQVENIKSDFSKSQLTIQSQHDHIISLRAEHNAAMAAQALHQSQTSSGPVVSNSAGYNSASAQTCQNHTDPQFSNANMSAVSFRPDHSSTAEEADRRYLLETICL